MTDKIADELRALANTAGRTLSDNSMMPPGIPGIGDVLAEKMASLMRTAADELDAREAGGWQPIETAPKDGTEFIGIQYHGRFSDPGIVRWDDSDQEWWDMDADQYGFPTHWQPLLNPLSRLLNKEDRNG